MRLLQEIASVVASAHPDNLELAALTQAALTEREEAGARWRHERARLQATVKRQSAEIEALKCKGV